MKEEPKAFERFGARWTPTVLVLDPDGAERRRLEGYLPPEDFLAQLELGLARVDFERSQWDAAEKRYRHIVDRHPNTDAAPEAPYWAGCGRYKATGDGGALADTARRFKERYTDTPWAKRASVWGG